MSNEELGAEARPWTDQDYIDHVMGRIKPRKTISCLVREEIEKRIRLGEAKYNRPLRKDTCKDNLQEAIEECADMLFYLICERESRRAKE